MLHTYDIELLELYRRRL